VPLQPFPALVPSLTGIPVTLMAAGGTHSLFIALSGLVYCCGNNKLGQLGLNRVDEKGTHQHLFRNVTLQMSLLLPMSDYLSLLFLLTQLFVLFEYNY
jgi:alpha-tubulin suppressor-like RCC1 family protein